MCHPPTIPPDATANADRFYTMVKSLNNFNTLHVRGVVQTLLGRTNEENCYIGTYYRVGSNIETILELQKPTHFQAAMMLARALFELAVDMNLLDIIPYASDKMTTFADVDKLRYAQRVVAFKTANSTADVDISMHQELIANRAQDIEKRHRILWPNEKHPTKPRQLSHWSGLRLPDRVKLLKPTFEQLYEIDYPRMSWYVHPGLTGIANLKPEVFTYICSYAFKLAADSFWEVLLTIIRKFKIAKANEKIEWQLEVAKMLPFTDNPEQVEVLLRSIR